MCQSYFPQVTCQTVSPGIAGKLVPTLYEVSKISKLCIEAVFHYPVFGIVCCFFVCLFWKQEET